MFVLIVLASEMKNIEALWWDFVIVHVIGDDKSDDDGECSGSGCRCYAKFKETYEGIYPFYTFISNIFQFRSISLQRWDFGYKCYLVWTTEKRTIRNCSIKINVNFT